MALELKPLFERLSDFDRPRAEYF